MHDIIQTRWRAPQRELPGINCVVYPDDNVIILNCRRFYDPNNVEYTMYCSPLCDTTIASLEKYDAAYWTLVDAWTSLEYQGGKIYGGDGQMGNEGFIARTDSNDDLLWGMFFENTNPIKTLAIRDGILVAVNEHDELRIEINLNELTDIKMTYLSILLDE